MAQTISAALKVEDASWYCWNRRVCLALTFLSEIERGETPDGNLISASQEILLSRFPTGSTSKTKTTCSASSNNVMSCIYFHWISPKKSHGQSNDWFDVLIWTGVDSASPEKTTHMPYYTTFRIISFGSLLQNEKYRFETLVPKNETNSCGDGNQKRDTNGPWEPPYFLNQWAMGSISSSKVDWVDAHPRGTTAGGGVQRLLC